MRIRKSILLLVAVLCLCMVFPMAASAIDPHCKPIRVIEISATPLAGDKMQLDVEVTDDNPYPLFQWYVLDPDGNWELIPGAIGSKMILEGYDSDKEYIFQVQVTSKHVSRTVVSAVVRATAE